MIQGQYSVYFYNYINCIEYNLLYHNTMCHDPVSCIKHVGLCPALGVMIRCVVILKSALIIASWTSIQRIMIQVAGSRCVASLSNLGYPDTDMCVRIRRTRYTYVCNDMMYQIHQAGAHYDISDTEKRCIRHRVKTCIKHFTDVVWGMGIVIVVIKLKY